VHVNLSRRLFFLVNLVTRIPDAEVVCSVHALLAVADSNLALVRHDRLESDEVFFLVVKSVEASIS